MSLETYKSAKRPGMLWFLGSVAAAALLYFGDRFFFHLEFHRSFARFDLGRVLFIYYSIIFLCFWIVYFASERLNLQTLRLLLKLTSKQWETGKSSELDAKDHEQLVEGYQEKGKITITAQSILIAVSTLMIVNIYHRRLELTAEIGTKAAAIDPDIWEKSLLNAGMLFAVSAFVLLIYAVDCMDTMFNQFKEKPLDIINYLYLISSRKKYYGMLCVMTAIILFVGSVLPTIAAFGIGLFLFIGYKFWCPSGDLDHATNWDRLGSLTRLALCAAPLFVILVHGDGF